MAQRYPLLTSLLSAGLLAWASPAVAQQAVPDSALYSRPLLLKVGLRLTHLRYAHDNKSWQFLLPLSLGAEYRLAPRLSLYTQLEADMQATYTSNRRSARRNTLAAASAALGVRYYYGGGPQAGVRFGRYLALEGTTDWEQLANARWPRASSGGRRAKPAVLTPGVYAVWGVQHRLRHHTYYDVSAGAGVLAPAYYNFERPSTTNRWNVGGQASIRLYFGL
jgi:hypothetical protein